MGLMGIVPLLVIGLVVWLVVEERYARGEIEREEYLERRCAHQGR